MKQRVGPNYYQRHRYFDRGISVCERWASFALFLEDMGEKPEGSYLDRVDNDGHYEPGNCRWITPKESARNTSQNRLIEHGGRAQTLAAWAEQYGLLPTTLAYRLRTKNFDDAVAAPPYRVPQVCDGKTLSQLARELGVNPCTLKYRMAHWPKSEWGKAP